MTTDPITRDTLVVQSANGLHLVPCSQIARLVSEFQGTVTLSRGDRTADAKTVIEIASLGASQGTELEVVATGEGGEQVIADLKELFAAGFPVPEPSDSE